LAAVVYGLIRYGEQSCAEPIATFALADGAVLLVAFGVIERRTRHPLVSLDFFQHRA
jgi:hypothetical protein